MEKEATEAEMVRLEKEVYIEAEAEIVRLDKEAAEEDKILLEEEAKEIKKIQDEAEMVRLEKEAAEAEKEATELDELLR